MADVIDFERAEIVLYHGVALRHVAELPVLGVPLSLSGDPGDALPYLEQMFRELEALE